MVTMNSYQTFSSHVRDNSPVALVTVIEGPHVGATMVVTPAGIVGGSLGNPDIDRIVARDALGELEAGRTLVRHYGPHGEAREDAVSVFIESFAPPPHMLIFGAVDFTGALVKVAKVMGYRVTVCDAREVFATKRRFPNADEVVVDWPHRHLEMVGDRLGQRARSLDHPAEAAGTATDGHIDVIVNQYSYLRRQQVAVNVGRREGLRGPRHHHRRCWCGRRCRCEFVAELVRWPG